MKEWTPCASHENGSCVMLFVLCKITRSGSSGIEGQSCYHCFTAPGKGPVYWVAYQKSA